jgi:hypothetical protein
MIAGLFFLVVFPAHACGCSTVEWGRLLQRLPACDEETIFRADFEPLPWLGFA